MQQRRTPGKLHGRAGLMCGAGVVLGLLLPADVDAAQAPVLDEGLLAAAVKQDRAAPALAVRAPARRWRRNSHNGQPNTSGRHVTGEFTPRRA